MAKEINIAVLLTCYNRKEKTYACIKSVIENSFNCDIFLVDDGSTDGTSDIISKTYPQVKIIKGTGNLYWNRGMHLAWETASKFDYDYYLWLNDDTMLLSNSISELLSCYEKSNYSAIISGIVVDDAGKTIYGGFDSNKNLIKVDGMMNPVHFMHGNVVLISRKIFRILGNLDPIYHHDIGDVDYGLRAIKNNIPVLTSTKPVAVGEINSICRERLNEATIIKRFKNLYSPLGSNPFINYYHRKKHYSRFNAIAYFFFQHILNAIPDFINSKLFKEKYQ